MSSVTKEFIDDLRRDEAFITLYETAITLQAENERLQKRTVQLHETLAENERLKAENKELGEHLNNVLDGCRRSTMASIRAGLALKKAHQALAEDVKS